MQLALPDRYDLAIVCGPLARGANDPSARIGSREIWRAANTPHGPASLHVCVRGRVAHAQAWGDGAAWTLARVPQMLGLHDEPAALVTDHALVGSWQRSAPALRLTSGAAVFDIAARTVIEQRVTGLEAVRTWFGMVRRLGTPAPGPTPGLRVPPAPSVVAGLGDRERRAFGLEARRGETLRRVAVEAGRLDRAAANGPGVLDRVLRAIGGVGAWTSATVRDLALGDPDAVVVGDWHLGRQVVFAFTGDRRGDDARMLELLAPFAGQRGRVARLALAAGPALARRTPRAGIPDLLARERSGRPYRVRNGLRGTIRPDAA